MNISFYNQIVLGQDDDDNRDSKDNNVREEKDDDDNRDSKDNNVREEKEEEDEVPFILPFKAVPFP